MAFIERLNSFRKTNESRNAFAKRLNVAYGTLLNWERGQEPTRGTIERLAGLLACDPKWLMFGEEPDQPGC